MTRGLRGAVNPTEAIGIPLEGALKLAQRLRWSMEPGW